MSNIFSHPAFTPSDNFVTVGYNLVKSTSAGQGPNYFGPWNAVSGYTGYTNNLSILDSTGSPWDLYRVQPIIQATVGGILTGSPIPLEFSRAFTAKQPLYDSQISSLLETFRLNWLNDMPIAGSDSTNPMEATGLGAAPFITDSTTSRFFLSFIPNADPVKFRPEETVVYMGSPATPLVPYTDYFPNGDKGYIDFAVTPDVNSYLRVDYKYFQHTDDECRNTLVNAISKLSSFGITGFEVRQSWNLTYLVTPLPNRDLGELLCAIGQHNFLGSTIVSSFNASEAWRDGSISYTSDPSRSIQAGTAMHSDLFAQINSMANQWIINNRTYFARGEFDSFFDNSGIFYPPMSTYNVFNYYGWWL